MIDGEILLEITKIILITSLIILSRMDNFKINEKLDEIIKLNTSEIIHIAPDEIL